MLNSTSEVGYVGKTLCHVCSLFYITTVYAWNKFVDRTFSANWLSKSLKSQWVSHPLAHTWNMIDHRGSELVPQGSSWQPYLLLQTVFFGKIKMYRLAIICTLQIDNRWTQHRAISTVVSS